MGETNLESLLARLNHSLVSDRKSSDAIFDHFVERNKFSANKVRREKKILESHQQTFLFFGVCPFNLFRLGLAISVNSNFSLICNIKLLLIIHRSHLQVLGIMHTIFDYFLHS